MGRQRFFKYHVLCEVFRILCLMLADQLAQCTCAVPSTFKPTYPLPSLGGTHNLSELLVLTRCRGNSCYNSLPWCSSFPYLFLLHYLPDSGIPFLLISSLSSHSRTAYIYCMHSLNPYAICCITTGQGTLSSSQSLKQPIKQINCLRLSTRQRKPLTIG